MRQKQKQNKKKITKTKENKNIKENMGLGSNVSRPDIDLSLFHVRQFYVLSHQGGGGGVAKLINLKTQYTLYMNQ